MLKYTVTITLYIVIFAGMVTGLYEDQIGKFDWKKEYIGQVEEAVFESSLSVSKHVYVSTAKNIIACISTRTGQIVWRKTLGENEGKVVHLSHIKSGVVSVSSGGMARLWEASTGALKWEFDVAGAGEESEDFTIYDVATLERSYTEGNLLVVLSNSGLFLLPMTQSKHKPDIKSAAFDQMSAGASNHRLFIDSSSGKIIVIQQQSGTRLLTMSYDMNDDLDLVSQTAIDTSWLDSLDMISVLEDGKVFYISEEAGAVHLVDPTSGDNVITATLINLGIDDKISSITVNKNKDIKTHGVGVIIFHGDSEVSYLKPGLNGFEVNWKKSLPGLFDVMIQQQGSEVYAFFACSENEKINVLAMDFRTGSLDDSLTLKYRLRDRSEKLGRVHINMYLKQHTPIGFRAMLSFIDHSFALVSHPNRLVWLREEALASVVDATMMDLPLSDVDAGIEAEFDDKVGKTNLINMFLKRVKAQGGMLLSWMKQLLKDINDDTLFSRKTKDPLIQVEGMLRDPFSLHKMLVLVTEPGVLYGIDSLTGDIAWRYFSEKLRERKLHFFVQRTTAHFPHPPQAMLLGVNPDHSQYLVAFKLQPITGTVNDVSNDLSRINTPFIQVMLSPFTDEEYIRPLILLDSKLKVHFIPDTVDVHEAMRQAKLFMYDVNVNDGLLRGFAIENTKAAQLVWSTNILPTHKIVGFSSKPPFEKVDSMGRPLADRSVIYKYLNPNAIAVLSESLDNNADRSSLILHIIDAVNGQIIHSIIHKKASGPVHMVHSENWLIYSYWNRKARRTELASIEMYEGKEQYNDTAFSSFHTRPPPIIMQQSYIFPAGIACMGVSRTEKGLTSRQILFALKRGSLFGMPRRYFDPRRPLHVLDSHKEEGLMPYMPEVPIPPELFLSYNLTLEGARKIYNAPAALESTSLILVTGFDLFFTRTQPSKMFDVLKEDFEYLFISGVLLVMFVAVLVTRRMAQVKQLNKAWR